LPPPDLTLLLGEARALTQRYKAGKNPDSFLAFRDLIQLLLGTTILQPGASVHLIKGPRPDARALGGMGGPLPLTDGRFLRLTMRLFLAATKDGPRVKIESSSFQYQMDTANDHWIFRYDYVRSAPDQHPSAHVHVRGDLTERCLGAKQALEDVHFPTQRVSLESVIRLLIEQFNVPANNPSAIWRPLLAQSEAMFLEIAHKALSGPAN
jgi:hypothetical protein